jgi:poly(3-hydroxybutyrate) depolymerase
MKFRARPLPNSFFRFLAGAFMTAAVSLGLALLCPALLCQAWAQAWAQEPHGLKSHNASIAESSISGISSGGFMAVQFGMAWSSVIEGVGVIAGGPYYCAHANLVESAVTFGAGALLAATGPCMVGPLDDIGPQLRQAEDNAKQGEIDPLTHVADQKIYIFHGYNDNVVARSVTDAAVNFYRHFLGDKATGNLFYQTAIGAGHSIVVPDLGQKGLDACPDNQTPYINRCGYDQAGVLLQHIYGALNPPTLGPLGGKLASFDQSLYTGDDIPDALSLAKEGFVFVPKDCAQGAACRVHIALHGCTQDAGAIGKKFVELAGYNRWADANRIIVLYPQTTASAFLPFNPKACWDWWGYVDGSGAYVTKSGKQIKAIKAMLDALTAKAGPAPDVAAAPPVLIVNDRDDTSVALAWTAAPGATAYRVERAGADGAFQPIGETSGLSFADSGLAPATVFSWRVAPLVNGVEQAGSDSVTVSTLPPTAPCNAPGTCALAQ